MLAAATFWATKRASLSSSSPTPPSANCAPWKGTQYSQCRAEAAPNATNALSRAESLLSFSCQLSQPQNSSSIGSGMASAQPGTDPNAPCIFA